MFSFVRYRKILFKKTALAAFFVVLMAMCLLVGPQASVANGISHLVETQWLADSLNDPNTRILYVARMDPKDFENFKAAHIPGAKYLDLGSLMGALGNGSAPPDKAKFEEVMGRHGIANDTHVVLYGVNNWEPFITTAYWLLQYNGHKKVSYLNGGLAKWNNEKRKTVSSAEDKAKVTPTNYKATPDESLRADAGYVLKNLKNSDVVILDVRSPDEFTGKFSPVENKRTGHVPGAVNMDFAATNISQNGAFKSVDALKKAYQAKGVTKDKEIIVYCQGGVRASHTFFVLKKLLDYPNVRNYVGSWGEWGNRLDPAQYPLEK